MRISDWSSDVCSSDLTMPGMIWAKVLRSPHPHAVIRGIDTSKAEALPGVKAVVTAKDFVDFPIDTPVPLGIQDMRWMSRNMLAREKALFHGHPVAAVAALDERTAAAACALIEVELGRAARRARVRQYVDILVVAGALKKNKT